MKDNGRRMLQRTNVRTGCTTCKIRHLKCDENKPHCARCTRTGRNCGGYELESAHTTTLSAVLIHNISMDFPGTRQERRAFDFFRNCTVPEFCGYFEEGFWERNVLQVSFSQPALRHAAFAIGALHENFIAPARLLEKPADSRIPHYQYMKAISKLRSFLATFQQQSEQHSVVALMTCILLACFDCLVGKFDSAVRHFRGGLSILLKKNSGDITFLRRILSRLSLQAIYFTDSHTRANVLFLEQLVSQDVCHDNTGFSTLANARESLNSIIGDMMYHIYSFSKPEVQPVQNAPLREPARWIGEGKLRDTQGMQVLKLCGDEDDSHKSTQHFPPTPSGAGGGQLRYSTSLQNWSTAFSAFFQSSNLHLSGKALRGATLLKIHHLVATLMVSESLYPTRQPLELFTPAFEQIVALCTSLVQAELQRRGSFFSSDLGIIAPLYYSALNCKAPHIRLQVLKLLSTPRREGMWDSRIALFVIEQVTKLESERAGEGEGLNIDFVSFHRTPKEAADEIELCLGDSGSGRWMAYLTLIPW